MVPYRTAQGTGTILERQTAIMLEKIISTLIQPESPDTALLQSGGTKISLHTFTIMM